MNVIGFFGDLLSSVGALVQFVTTDINTLYGGNIAIIGNLSIIQMFSVSIGATLIFFLSIHLFRLIIGG